jgi:uncharacterized protein YyaL (SSP411 family)
LGRPREIAIVGDPAAADTQALLRVAQGAYRPNQVVAVGPPGDPPAVPLLEDRAPLDGHATAFVCQRFACQLPVTTPGALEAQLAE